MNSIEVLVVDDDQSVQQVICQVLSEEGYPVTTVASGEEAVALCRERSYDIVITDVRLPGMNGLQLLAEVKKLNEATQVIIITSYASLESAVSALRAGAYDYLAKPFDELEVISVVVKRAAEKITLSRENAYLIQDLVKSKEELEQVNAVLRDLAIRDGLTGLYNHRYFQEFLTMELSRAPRHQNRFCLVFMDVDHFKKYNDTHGHLEGDKLLRQLGVMLRSRLRKMDLVARYGGEEFIMLLPDTGFDEGVAIAEQIRRQIQEYPFSGGEMQPGGCLTVSMGVASFPHHGADAVSIIKSADKALYEAKRAGRNRVCGAD